MQAWTQAAAFTLFACLSAASLSNGQLAVGQVAVGQAVVGQDATSDVPPAGAVTAKLLRYSERLVQRHDANGDGRLDATEWATMQGAPATADLDGDGQLTVREFARYAAEYGAGRRIRLSTRSEPPPQAPKAPGESPLATGSEPGAASPIVDKRRDMRYFAPLPSGTPGWFVERDTDGDAQLTLAEFSPRLRSTEIAEFKRYDLNGDGLLTGNELVRAAAKPATPAGNAPAPRVPATP